MYSPDRRTGVMSFLVYFFVVLVAASSVLFGMDWMQAPLAGTRRRSHDCGCFGARGRQSCPGRSDCRRQQTGHDGSFHRDHRQCGAERFGSIRDRNAGRGGFAGERGRRIERAAW